MWFGLPFQLHRIGIDLIDYPLSARGDPGAQVLGNNRRGFLEKMQYSEDDEYTRWCRANGYHIRYVPESVAMHSHNYTPEQAYRRSFGEGRALAAVWPGSPAAFRWPRTVALGFLNDARRDLAYCVRQQLLGEWPYALRIRWQQRRGRCAGFRDGWIAYRKTLGAPRPPAWAAPQQAA